MNEDVNDLYTEIFMEIYSNPHNFGVLDNADLISEDSNPLCGDKINLYIKIKDNKVEEVKYNGKGCAISMVSASLLTDHIKGMTIEQLKEIKPEEVIDLLKVPIGASRIKCALLPLVVLRKALKV
jgi:nitrogen fixation NifU-like protein